MFKHYFASIRPFQSNSLERFEDLILPAESRVARNVRRLLLDLGKHAFFWDNYRTEHEGDEFHAFTKIILLALSRLPNIECLALYMSDWCITSPWDGDAPTFDLSMVAELKQTLVTAFEDAPFEHLTDIRLILPCAYDFKDIGDALSDEKLGRLRHLYLEFIDGTGPGGTTSQLVYYDEDSDGDGEVEFSNLQELWPNDGHVSNVCDIVNRCSNLESLGLCGTQYIDGDLLKWTPLTGGGLINLYLERVKISYPTLLRLLSPAAHSPLRDSPLYSMSLQEIHLRSGTWADIFKHLMRYPSLSYLDPMNLAYERYGESSHLKEYSGRMFETGNNIWFYNADDEILLKGLMYKLVRKAGGLEYYPGEKDELMMMSDEDLEGTGLYEESFL